MIRIFLIGCFVLHGTTFSIADDWQHWRGRDRNDIANENSGWSGTEWPLEESWKTNVGEGSTTPIIVGKRLFTMGWRIGYAAGPQEVISAMKTIQSQSTSNPCSISQVAAQAALDGDQSAVAEMAAAYKKRHDYVVPMLNEIDGVECRRGEGTFYAFPRVNGALANLGLSSDTALVELLINNANVACVPGSAFGAPGYMRLSFACSLETLEEAIKRIKRALTA